MKSVSYFLAIGCLVIAACGDDGAQGTCDDGIQNQDESAVDCGGICGPCTVGDACRGPGDCDSGVCSANICLAPSCDDNTRNGDETDVDCGGSCPACEAGAVTCGDSVAELPEECDAGGESATCDVDCTAVLCGDMTVNATANEECDDGFPTANCDDDCTFAVCGDGSTNPYANEECDDAGESATCDDDCSAVACGDGNTNEAAGESCDDAGESAACDDDCSVVACGDGNTNEAAGEACDDSGESATCDVDCSIAECGDGTTNATAGEACDDSGESATCDADCSAVACGDGYPNTTAGEECDDAGESALCDADCTAAFCGDGTTNGSAGEACDDAGESSNCNANCTIAVCGDGIVNPTAGEECDDAGASAACDVDCTLVACGDGIQNPAAGEHCDDGNVTDGDGCSAVCIIETPPPVDIALPGGSIVPAGTIDGTEPLWARPLAGCGATSPADHYYDVISIVNNTGADQVLTMTATWAGGDGFLHVFTDPFDPFDLTGCVIGDDDFNGTGQSQIVGVNITAGQVLHVIASTFSGNVAIGDYTIDIRTAGCGDGIVDPGEECDDGNTTPGDGCDAVCLIEVVCGDGVVTGSEECDDGNTTDGDGCSSVCTFETTEVEPNDDATNANPYTDPFIGSIGVPGDFDFVLAPLAAGESVTAEVVDLGNGTCAANQLDSELRIFDVDGVTEVAFDDDGGGGWCSMVSFTAPADGLYYVRVASSQQFDPTGTFPYQLLLTFF